jgi:D-glycero-beta-D-manno-heptose 1-phosphate adenylyltransferase
MNSREKIQTVNELRPKLDWHRGRGERIVFANGCFDLLHVGHVRYLAGACKEGDVLVVAINSDKSVELLKGAGRPILPASARGELVAALACVNYVVIFDESDVGLLLRELRPDVHAKGTDYSPDTVPERDEAARLGVRIAIVGDRKNHSTSDLLSRVRDGRG